MVIIITVSLSVCSNNTYDKDNWVGGGGLGSVLYAMIRLFQLSRH